MYRLFFLLTVCLPFAHPIHIGVTEIDYNSSSKSLQVTHKFFVDDFEKMLEKRTGEKLHLGSSKEHQKADTYIQEYLSEAFGISIDNKKLDDIWIGKEVESEAIWIYVEYPKVKKVKSLAIKQEAMLETFDDQKNLVHFTYQGFKKNLTLEQTQTSAVITVEN